MCIVPAPEHSLACPLAHSLTRVLARTYVDIKMHRHTAVHTLQHSVYPGLGSSLASTTVTQQRSSDGDGDMARSTVEHNLSPLRKSCGALTSWKSVSPWRPSLTPLDTLIQEKEGNYIRSPTKVCYAMLCYVAKQPRTHALAHNLAVLASCVVACLAHSTFLIRAPDPPLPCI